jgi:hypothetical protein
MPVNTEFREKLALAVVEKLLLAVVAGVVLIAGQYLVEHGLETWRADLAYDNAVAASRIATLQGAWEAIHRYGVSVASAATVDPGVSRKDWTTLEADLTSAADDFERALAHAGAFTGLPWVQCVRSELGYPALREVIAELKAGQPGAGERFVAEWEKALDQLSDQILKRPDRTAR